MSYQARQSFGLKTLLRTTAGTAPVKAALSIGSSNAVVALEAVKGGVGGNNITVAFISPGTGTQSLGVVVTGEAIVVNLGYAASAITSTANEVIAAILASPQASALVTAGPGAGTGVTIVAAATAAPLTGGTNGPAVYSEIPGIGDIEIPGMGRASDDITSHSSAEGFAEYLKSKVKDGRSITFPINYDPANVVHQQLKLAEASDDPSRFRFVYPYAGGDFENDALVLNFSTSSPVRGVFTGSIEMQLTGAPLQVDLA
jgi:hypothetical protein